MNRLFLMRLLSLGCTVLFTALSGCSTSTPSPSTSAPKATGVTGTLSKLPGAPLWNLESVGPVNNAWEKKIFDLPAHGQIDFVGWAVDQAASAPAGGVEIAVDGTPFAAQYGKPRPDVATAYGIPSYANAGYSLALTAEQYPPGHHTAFVRVLANDRKGFWEVGPYTLNLQ
jgi:hypothetical protein